MLPALLICCACGSGGARTWDDRYAQAQQRLETAQTPKERFYALTKVAKAAVELGKLEEAEVLAQELLSMAPGFRTDWNYGNAIHDGHMVLGRVVLRRGDRTEAKRQLLAAGATPGSPQLDTFGPNMSLAKDLLDQKEHDTVLAYFTLCERFWESSSEHLPGWRAAIEKGQAPDFGANLLY